MTVTINLTRGYGYRTSILNCLIVLLAECDSMGMEIDIGGGDRLPPRWLVINVRTTDGYLMTVAGTY
jgi:hypothetical protein